MYRMNNLKEILIISSIAGFCSEIFSTIQTSYVILLLLSGVDTVTGILGAIKFKRFTSKGLGKLIKKVTVYTACVFTLRLLEMGIVDIIETTILSQIMVSFLILLESISILENLALLGAPIPAQLISYFIKQFNIPGLEYVLKRTRGEEKDLEELEEMLKYHLAALTDKHTKVLMEIKFKVWMNIITQINIILGEYTDYNNKELLYYKLMSTIQLGFKEMHVQWKEQGIPKKYIANLDQRCQEKVDSLLSNVKEICYTDEPLFKKKDRITQSIKILLYQTIMNERKES